MIKGNLPAIRNLINIIDYVRKFWNLFYSKLTNKTFINWQLNKSAATETEDVLCVYYFGLKNIK